MGGQSIDAWLKSIGLEQYTEAFRVNDIDMEVVETLGNDDLKELGLSLGHRKKFEKALVALNAEETSGAPVAEDESEVASPQAGHSGDQAQILPSATTAERRQLTVMFADLVDSTALSLQFDPEDLADIVRSYQRTCQTIVHNYGGYIARYMGDGILVYFGYPKAHENDISRALHSASEITTSVAALNPLNNIKLQARVGVATGLVVVGETIGEHASREQVVVGETPNLAARLQSIAAPGCSVVSQLTKKLAGPEFIFEPLEEQKLKGFDRPERCWRLRQVLPYASITQRVADFHLQTLAGREEELNLLRERWQVASDGEGQFVLLDGEAGVGKSALTDALQAVANESAAEVLRCQCSQLHSNTVMYPLVMQLQDRSKVLPEDTTEEKLQKLLSLFSYTDRKSTVELLTELTSLDRSAQERNIAVTPARQKQLIMELMVSEIVARARSHPMLLVYEDVHWADASTLQFIDLLSRKILGSSVLIVVTHRPDFNWLWSSQTQLTRLSVARLGQQSCRDIVFRVCNQKSLPESLVQQILEKADGVPLFVEELTKSVIESEQLTEDSEGFNVNDAGLTQLQVPSSLSDSLTARLDRLNTARTVAQTASVIGREFDYQTLALLTDNVQTLAESLESLEQAGIVFGSGFIPEASYRFKHALVQDAAYNSILNTTRRKLHHELATHYIAARGNKLGVADELIAEHLYKAGAPLESMRYRLHAGQQAIERFAHLEARTQLMKCLQDAREAAQTDQTKAGMTAAVAEALLGDLAGYQGDLNNANTRYRSAIEHTSNKKIRQWINCKLHFQHSVQSNGAKVTYYVHGDGKQTLLLMNPLAYGLGVFQPILDNLGQDFTIVTMDCRGTGESDALIRPFGVVDHMHDVASVIRSLGRGPVTGVGISRGSNILIHLAAKFPELINGLVTVGCPISPPNYDGKTTFHERYMRERIAYTKNGDIKSLVELQYSFVYTEPGTDEVRKAASEHVLKLPPDTVLSFYDSDPNVNVVDLLPALRVNTLVMHGKEDKLVGLDASRYLAREIAGASLYCFDGAGHLPTWTATEEFCQQIRKFLKTKPVGATSAEVTEWAADDQPLEFNP